MLNCFHYVGLGNLWIKIGLNLSDLRVCVNCWKFSVHFRLTKKYKHQKLSPTYVSFKNHQLSTYNIELLFAKDKIELLKVRLETYRLLLGSKVWNK